MLLRHDTDLAHSIFNRCLITRLLYTVSLLKIYTLYIQKFDVSSLTVARIKR